MWSYEVWQLYILIIGTVWIGCRMTLFSVALHQHSFNLFISVLFQDKLSCSHESTVVPMSLVWNGSTESQDQIPNSSTLPLGHGAPAQSLLSLEVRIRRDFIFLYFFSSTLFSSCQSISWHSCHQISTCMKWAFLFSPFCSTRREGAAPLDDLSE